MRDQGGCFQGFAEWWDIRGAVLVLSSVCGVRDGGGNKTERIPNKRFDVGNMLHRKADKALNKLGSSIVAKLMITEASRSYICFLYGAEVPMLFQGL